MSFIYKENIEEIDTFESYFKSYLIKDNKLLMPYINIGISEHPLNTGKELQYLNYSYVICTDIILIKYNGELIYDETLGKFGSCQIIYLGGTDLKININVEYQVICKDAFLQITDKTQLSKTFWIPTKSPNLGVNMNVEQVNEFFSLKFLPENLQNLFR